MVCSALLAAPKGVVSGVLDALSKRARKGNTMSDLKLNSDDIRKLQKSIYLTQDRAESEGFVGTDEALEALKELTYMLLNGGSLDSFLSALDMVDPDS